MLTGLRPIPPCQVSSWSIRPFGHNTPTSETDRQTDRQDRQRSDSIGESVSQTVAQKWKLQCRTWPMYEANIIQSRQYVEVDMLTFESGTEDAAYSFASHFHAVKGSLYTKRWVVKSSQLGQKSVNNVKHLVTAHCEVTRFLPADWFLTVLTEFDYSKVLSA